MDRIAERANSKENDLKGRTFRFAVNVVKFLKTLRFTTEVDVVKKQLLRSATSIGANYEEAQGAFSRDDFGYKISICYKEARKTNYRKDLIEKN